MTFPQWGVMFMDGSVRHCWNGKTQRERATEERDRLNTEYSPDRFRLVYRESMKSPWVVVE